MFESVRRTGRAMHNSPLHDDQALASRVRHSAFDTLDRAVEMVRQAQAAVTFYYSDMPRRRLSATEFDELRTSLADVRGALAALLDRVHELEQLAATLNQQLAAEMQGPAEPDHPPQPPNPAPGTEQGRSHQPAETSAAEGAANWGPNCAH